MKRSLVYLALAVLLVFSLAGCEMLFGPRVQSVEPDDLPAYEATSTVDGNDDALLAATVAAATGSDGTGGAGSAFEAVFDSADFQNEMDELMGSVSPGASIFDYMSGAVSSQVERARSIVMSGEVDDNLADGLASGEGTVTIENQTVAGAHGGTATVERFFLDASASVELDLVVQYLHAEGAFDHDARVLYDEFSADGVVLIHAGEVNTEGSGRGEFTVAGDTVSASWRLGFAFSAGFSFSNLSEGTGGKVIADFRYSDRGSFTFDKTENPDAIANSLTGDMDLELHVQLYDNANELVYERSYTDEEIYDHMDL